MIGAFAPSPIRNNLVDSARSVSGLQSTSASLQEVRGAMTAAQGSSGETIGGIGILITLLSATACSRVLQRLCERSWHLPPAGARPAAWRWVAWLAVWLVLLVFQSRIRDGFGAGQPLGLPMALVAAVLMWWWTQHILLAGRTPWLPLLPGAILTGGALIALTGLARLYVPRSLDQSVTRFGPLGLVFTVFSWLIVLFTAITVCVAAGYVIAHSPRLRSRAPAVVATDTPSSLGRVTADGG